MRNKSNKIFLCIQTLKDTENFHRDVGGYDMSYDEFNYLCRKSWEEEYIYLCFDRPKKRGQARYCICNERKNTYVDCIPTTKPF